MYVITVVIVVITQWVKWSLRCLCVVQSSSSAAVCQSAVEAAIAAGYRHIDTAYSYRNEVEISKALRSKMQQGIIQRQDMYGVSKVGAAAEC